MQSRAEQPWRRKRLPLRPETQKKSVQLLPQSSLELKTLLDNYILQSKYSLQVENNLYSEDILLNNSESRDSLQLFQNNIDLPELPNNLQLIDLDPQESSKSPMSSQSLLANANHPDPLDSFPTGSESTPPSVPLPQRDYSTTPSVAPPLRHDSLRTNGRAGQYSASPAEGSSAYNVRAIHAPRYAAVDWTNRKFQRNYFTVPKHNEKNASDVNNFSINVIKGNIDTTPVESPINVLYQHNNSVTPRSEIHLDNFIYTEEHPSNSNKNKMNSRLHLYDRSSNIKDFSKANSNSEITLPSNDNLSGLGSEVTDGQYVRPSLGIIPIRALDSALHNVVHNESPSDRTNLRRLIYKQAEYRRPWLNATNTSTSHLITTTTTSPTEQHSLADEHQPPVSYNLGSSSQFHNNTQLIHHPLLPLHHLTQPLHHHAPRVRRSPSTKHPGGKTGRHHRSSRRQKVNLLRACPHATIIAPSLSRLVQCTAANVIISPRLVFNTFVVHNLRGTLSQGKFDVRVYLI